MDDWEKLKSEIEYLCSVVPAGNRPVSSVDSMFKAFQRYKSAGQDPKKALKVLGIGNTPKPAKVHTPVIPIESLDLQTHTLFILRWMKIRTLEDLKRVTRAQLKAVRNCGPNTIKDIKRELLSNGVKLS